MSDADEPSRMPRTSEARLDDAVRKALDAGLSWEQIGAQLGVSRRDARREYRRKLGIDRHRK